MVPVFNEHSLRPLAENEYVARARVSAFIALLTEAPERGFTRGLRTADSFYDLEVAPNYSIARWMSDRLAERDEVNYFLTVAMFTPVFHGVPSTITDQALQLEVKHLDESAPAFLAAYLLDVPIFSFNHQPWSEPILDAQLLTIDESDIVSGEQLRICNIAQPEHFDTHAHWITARRIIAIGSMQQFLDQRTALVPDLEFCPSVLNQLRAISKSNDAFDPILNHLLDMQAVSTGMAGDFSPASFKKKCRPSSQSTLECYVSDYTFRRENHQEILCGWHFYLPDGWRIYFGVFEKKLIVGHIGPHLPTRRFP